MRSFRLQNLRSFSDTGHIEIKPLTLLLGINSSGKSTFLRTLPLLRQSIEARTIGPLLWCGRFVDFGSFQESIWTGAGEKQIIFCFKFTIEKSQSDDSGLYFYEPFGQDLAVLEDMEVELSLGVGIDEKTGNTKSRFCTLEFHDNKIRLEIDNDGKLTLFKVNGYNVIKDNEKITFGIRSRNLVPVVFERAVDKKEEISDSPKLGLLRTQARELPNIILNEIGKIAHHKTSKDTRIWVMRSLGLGSSEAMLKKIKNLRFAGATWKDRVSNWSVDSQSFINLRDKIIANFTTSILSRSDEVVAQFVSNVTYIAPLRATAERFYRMQDLAIDEVDFQGRNLPFFLRNMTDFERRSFGEWTQKYFGFLPIVKSSAGHLSLKLKDIESGEEFNLADMGFGFSQILPVLTQLWVLSSGKARRGRRRQLPVLFAIEQPELHLHPKLQAQVADSFVAAIQAAKDLGVDLRLIIETHSEAIVNRLGHHVHCKKLSSSEINIVVFEKEVGENQTNIRLSSYDNDGYLHNWPIGFFEPEMI